MNVDNSGNVSTGITESGAYEETHTYDDDNQAPSSLEYLDGEDGKANEMVISEEDDEEEVDELDSSEYEGLSMVGMLVNTDSGGYYEKDTEDMDVADETVSLDMNVGMAEDAMDNGLLEGQMRFSRTEIVEAEIPVEMEVDGEMHLFSQAAIAEGKCTFEK
jgi:hypothetical protein